MSEAARQGGCRCGRVRFEVTGEPMLTMACHCTGCQHMTASAFSLSEGYSSAAFRLIQGDVALGGIHGASHHYFCDYCKSWLYTEPEGVPDLVNVRSTQLDTPRREPPFMDTYLSEPLPWARTGAVHSYDKLPAMEEWPQLMQEFAAANASATEETNQ